MTELSSDQFEKVRQHIYVRLGLHFEEKKNYFLQKRIEKRIGALGYSDPGEYIFHLCYADKEGREMQALANLITTNETYMFREYEQLEAFANCCLPEILSVKQGKGEQRLRIWSAGCSSGEEAYTLAIILQEIFPQHQSWDCKIIATDVDENMLAHASGARYLHRSIRDVPGEYLSKYFIHEGETYTVRPSTTALVRFQHLNLHDRMAMRAMRDFDFIFCRNVLIYFDDLSRKTAVDHFYNALTRGGYIFLGHSESMGRISTAFKLKRLEGHLVYGRE